MSWLIDFLQRVLPCPNILTLKSRCFGALVAALAVDFGLRVLIKWPRVEVEITGAELSIVVVLAILLSYLVAVDVILEDRRRRFRMQLQSLIRDPNVPDEIKREIARALM